MADDGFDFKAPPRREAKRFEPPPWEREAFEELERRRAEDEQAQALLAAAESGEGAKEAAAATEEEAGQIQTEAVALASTADAEARPEGEGGAENADATGQGEVSPQTPPPDARVAQMLAELAAQEPRESERLWTVALGSAIVVGAIGGVLIIWAMAALIGARGSGLTGFAGGMVLLLFGAGFVFGALWLAYRTLRQRGVL